jgi:hypothetical protein
MSKASSSCFTLTLIITALFGLSVGAQGSSIGYITPPGSTVVGHAVDASARFTTGSGTIMVTLDNREVNPLDVTQNLSDLSFTVGNGTVTGASEGSGSATAITINGSRMITMITPLTTPGAVGWVLSEPTSTELKLNVLSGTGHKGPANTIIGPPNVSNVYSVANGSIKGNGAHNPFISETATWVIDAPNVSSGTTITSATFSFSTAAGRDVVGVPEPSSMLLLGSGILIFVQGFRCKLM